MKTLPKNNSRNSSQVDLFKFNKILKSKKPKNKEESIKYPQKFLMPQDFMMIIILI